MDSSYESSLVDSRSRKRVRFTDAELPSHVLKSEASTSKDPLASNTLLRASGFLPQVTPISSHRPAPATHDALPRPSARELFNCLPRSRRPEEEPGPSARELFNRLPQSRRPETTPSARDLFNRLPQSRRPDRPEAPRPSARELFNRLPQGHRLEAKPLGLSELYSALPRPSSPSSASTALGHLPPKPDNSLAGPKAVIDLTDDDDHDPIPPFEPIQPKGPISADTPLADLKAIHPSIFEEDRHQYIFNTTDDFATRQTKRSWAGSYHADDWVFAREELHADQVDRDRVLPILLWDAGYPAFAISPQEILSLHKYLAARYDFNDYEAYKLILARFRNTRAIEAYKARDRYSKLVSLSNSVEKCRQRLVNLSEEQHPT